jgi:hypothetical protein
MQTKQTPSNTFTRTLSEFNGGQSLAELSGEMAKLVAAVKATGKPGELVYKLKIKPANKGDVRTVSYEDDVNLKLPKPTRRTGIFFVTEENGLQRSDPDQREMELRTVPVPEQEAPREVKTA